jgi:hypothetical protein
MLWPWVYSVATVIIGSFFFWLRNTHRALYGLSEILVAFALMYVAYFPHGVGGAFLITDVIVPPTLWDILASKAVTFFGSVYAFVRGCDNIVTGLRES